MEAAHTPELRQDEAYRSMGDVASAWQADSHHQLAPEASLRVRGQGKQRMAYGNAASLGRALTHRQKDRARRALRQGETTLPVALPLIVLFQALNLRILC